VGRAGAAPSDPNWPFARAQFALYYALHWRKMPAWFFTREIAKTTGGSLQLQNLWLN
jgi:hypothetical protein